MPLLAKMQFPFVVIDEAAQVIEPALLIPLSRDARQVVMVGDQCPGKSKTEQTLLEKSRK